MSREALGVLAFIGLVISSCQKTNEFSTRLEKLLIPKEAYAIHVKHTPSQGGVDSDIQYKLDGSFENQRQKLENLKALFSSLGYFSEKSASPIALGPKVHYPEDKEGICVAGNHEIWTDSHTKRRLILEYGYKFSCDDSFPPIGTPVEIRIIEHSANEKPS